MLVSTLVDTGLAGLFGLLVGGFLNVVIRRLPQLLEHQWAAECALGTEHPGVPEFKLLQPNLCNHCGHVLRWHELVPVISFLLLRGKCSSCGAGLGLRHPVVEIATGALFVYCAQRWGITPAGAAWCGFCAAILALALIDWDTTLLPDDITLLLLWAGLVAAALGWNGLPLTQALWGAVAGYTSLWAVYQVFKRLTGQEGIGYGDFKLFSALGAWFGWQALLPMILMASIIGAIAGIAMKFSSGLREGGYMPFGPFLSGAGITTLICGPTAILEALGLPR